MQLCAIRISTHTIPGGSGAKACLVCVFVSEVCGAVSTFDCIWQVRYSVVVVLIEELGLRFANIRTNAAAT